MQPSTSLRQGQQQQQQQQQQLVRQGSPVAARLGPVLGKRLLLLRQPQLQSKQVTMEVRSRPCQMQRQRTMVPALPSMRAPRQAHCVSHTPAGQPQRLLLIRVATRGSLVGWCCWLAIMSSHRGSSAPDQWHGVACAWCSSRVLQPGQHGSSVSDLHSCLRPRCERSRSYRTALKHYLG